MSGHSKWATIRRKKGALDAKRGKLFTTLIKEIMIAARESGGDPETNPRLRTAMNNARNANMPNDNIKKAILRGTGELPGVIYEEISYEGYGPSGVAIMVVCLTDNKQRTVAEVRHIFNKYNGALAENGAVSWMFKDKGVINIPVSAIAEDTLMEHVLESDAEDMTVEDDFYQVTCDPHALHGVHEYFKSHDIPVESSEIAKLPQSTIKVDGRDAGTLMKLLDALEDLDDVKKVWANFDIDDKVLEQA